MAGSDEAAIRWSGGRVREKTLGVVDIGSNTVHLLVAKTDGRHVEPLVDISDGLRLGNDIYDTGSLSDEKIQALTETLIAFRDEALKFMPQDLHLLATQAVRTANNRDHILDFIRSRIDLPVDVLTPEQEAEYSFLGADLACPSVGVQAMVDIGGGSVQVALGHNGHVGESVSLPLGAARVAHTFLQSDPPTYLEEAHLVTYLAEIIPQLYRPRTTRSPACSEWAAHSGARLHCLTSDGRDFPGGRAGENARFDTRSLIRGDRDDI